MNEPKLMQTKAGKGYKVVIDGKWFYTTDREMLNLIRGSNKLCCFRSIPSEPDAGEIAAVQHCEIV